MADEINYYESSHTGDEIENSVSCVKNYISNLGNRVDGYTTFDKSIDYLGKEIGALTNEIGSDSTSPTTGIKGRIKTLEEKIGVTPDGEQNTLKDTVDRIEAIIESSKYEVETYGTLKEISLKSTVNSNDISKLGTRISKLESNNSTEDTNFSIQACTVNGREYDSSLDTPEGEKYYANGYSCIRAYDHLGKGYFQKQIVDEAESYVEISTDDRNYFYYYAIPFYKEAKQYAGSKNNNSHSSKQDFYQINTTIDEKDGNITETNFSISIKEAGLYQVSGSVYIDGRTEEGYPCKACILYKENDSEDFEKSSWITEGAEKNFDGTFKYLEDSLYTKKEDGTYEKVSVPYARELVSSFSVVQNTGAIPIPPKVVYLEKDSELFLAAQGYNENSQGTLIYPGNPSTYLSIIKLEDEKEETDDDTGSGEGAVVNSTINLIYPVGSIYMSVNNVNPATLFGGTWEQLKDRFLLGAGDTYASGSTGGSAEVTLENNNLPAKAVVYSDSTTPTGWSFGAWMNHNTESSWYSMIKGQTAIGETIVPVSNMPPYLTVYMWKRTA